MRLSLFLALGGAVMLAWGGARIGTRLGTDLWTQIDVAVFAVGIAMMARIPYVRLAARVRAARKAAIRGPGAPRP